MKRLVSYEWNKQQWLLSLINSSKNLPNWASWRIDGRCSSWPPSYSEWRPRRAASSCGNARAHHWNILSFHFNIFINHDSLLVSLSEKGQKLKLSGLNNDTTTKFTQHYFSWYFTFFTIFSYRLALTVIQVEKSLKTAKVQPTCTPSGRGSLSQTSWTRTPSARQNCWTSWWRAAPRCVNWTPRSAPLPERASNLIPYSSYFRNNGINVFSIWIFYRTE